MRRERSWVSEVMGFAVFEAFRISALSERMTSSRGLSFARMASLRSDFSRGRMEAGAASESGVERANVRRKVVVGGDVRRRRRAKRRRDIVAVAFRLGEFVCSGGVLVMQLPKV